MLESEKVVANLWAKRKLRKHDLRNAVVEFALGIFKILFICIFWPLKLSYNLTFLFLSCSGQIPNRLYCQLVRYLESFEIRYILQSIGKLFLWILKQSKKFNDVFLLGHVTVYIHNSENKLISWLSLLPSSLDIFVKRLIR